MKTTKRIISTILAVCLLASLCCTAAFAADLRLNDGSIKWHHTGSAVNDEDPANPDNPADPANPDNPADPADNPVDPSANPDDPANPNPPEPNPADPALEGVIILGGVNIYMSNLPQVGMKIEDASQGIFSCDGAVTVDSIAWLKANPEYVYTEDYEDVIHYADMEDGGYADYYADMDAGEQADEEDSGYAVSKYIPVTEDVFGKDKYAVQIVLRAVKDVATFADYVIATVNGMQAADVEMKGTDTCIVTFEFWELSDAVYLNIETAVPMVGGIASNMAYIANLNSDYYIDRNAVAWYRFAVEDDKLENGELVTGQEFDFNYRYAIELYISDLSENETSEDAKLHILLNGRDVEYTYTNEDKSMIRVFYVYDAYDMVNVDGEQVKGLVDTAPVYKIMDSVTVGDLSGDKKVEMTDVVELQRIIAKLAKLTNSADKFAADTNGDGVINMEDVTTMQKYIAKLIEKL